MADEYTLTLSKDTDDPAVLAAFRTYGQRLVTADPDKGNAILSAVTEAEQGNEAKARAVHVR